MRKHELELIAGLAEGFVDLAIATARGSGAPRPTSGSVAPTGRRGRFGRIDDRATTPNQYAQDKHGNGERVQGPHGVSLSRRGQRRVAALDGAWRRYRWQRSGRLPSG